MSCQKINPTAFVSNQFKAGPITCRLDTSTRNLQCRIEYRDDNYCYYLDMSTCTRDSISY